MFLGVAGCGGVAVSDVAEATGGQLTVYSSLPLQGPLAGVSQQIVDGEKLALHDAGGRAGLFKIDYDSLDDSSPDQRRMEPGDHGHERQGRRAGHEHDRLHRRLSTRAPRRSRCRS